MGWILVLIRSESANLDIASCTCIIDNINEFLLHAISVEIILLDMHAALVGTMVAVAVGVGCRVAITNPVTITIYFQTR